jgi:hypothetical protein
MADTLLVVGTVLGVFVFATLLLARRDIRRHRWLEERTPVHEGIARIKNDAEFMVEQLQRLLKREPMAREWAGATLEYYRRLETLAADPRPSADQAFRLAEEAGHFVHQKGLKGIWVAQQAQRLAELAQRLEDV